MSAKQFAAHLIPVLVRHFFGRRIQAFDQFGFQICIASLQFLLKKRRHKLANRRVPRAHCLLLDSGNKFVRNLNRHTCHRGVIIPHLHFLDTLSEPIVWENVVYTPMELLPEDAEGLLSVLAR